MSIIFQIALYCGITTIVVILFMIFYRGKDKKQINKFVAKLILYALPLVMLIGLFLINFKMMSRVLNGISMENQIITSFGNVIEKPYETIIMGNSRTYRGINPEMMDSTTYNFSFDNETFLEQYYKLIYLEQNKALPKRLILGVDYFEFSFLSQAMRGTYANYFVPQYDSTITELLKDGGKLEFKPIGSVDDWFNDKMSAVFGRGASQYLSHLGRSIAGQPLQAPYLKDDGQYIILPVPRASDGEFMKRSSEIKEYQRVKFEQIIDFAKQKGIEVILLMPPCREIELKCYTEEFKDSLDNYFSSFENVTYLNMSQADDFTTKDYMDDTHLTPKAADRFSVLLYNKIRTR